MLANEREYAIPKKHAFPYAQIKNAGTIKKAYGHTQNN